MKQEELDEVIEAHKLWVRGNSGARADLRSANLSGADLSGANLRSANLRSANLRSANLSGADLRSAEIELSQIPQIRIVPETGSFECWKKLEGGVIARLRVPASAGRVNSTGRKCRAERAKVVELLGRDGKPITEGFSKHDPGFIYKVGKMVVPDSYDPDFRVECSHGIHFFITRQEAEEY